MCEPVNQVLIGAKAEGYAASSYADCPYISGQRVLSEWIEGFVTRCVETGVTPAGTPLYILGQVAYLTGVPCSEMPDGESPAGRWLSGWLVQRDRIPVQPHKRSGDTLLDAIFG